MTTWRANILASLLAPPPPSPRSRKSFQQACHVSCEASLTCWRKAYAPCRCSCATLGDGSSATWHADEICSAS